MKKFLILFIFSASSVLAQTNIYHQFPDSNAIWNMHWSCSFGFGDAWFSYFIGGDTTIGNFVYQKIMKGPVVSTGTCATTGYPYLGALREDTAARKVYHIHPFESTEYLHLDFNLQVGDSFPAGPHFACSSVVQSLDSILIGNDYRKRWNLASGAQIIEGIGSTWGLFEPPCDVVDFPTTTLTCFAQDGVTLYPDTTVNCHFIDDVEEMSASKNSFIVFPNPATRELNVESLKMKVSTQLEIFNSIGEKIYSTYFRGQMTVDCRLFPRGIYFVRIQTESEIMNAKVLLE